LEEDAGNGRKIMEANTNTTQNWWRTWNVPLPRLDFFCFVASLYLDPVHFTDLFLGLGIVFFRYWIIKSGLYIRRCAQPIITELKRTFHERVKISRRGQ
jgi:hypothetical protein